MSTGQINAGSGNGNSGGGMVIGGGAGSGAGSAGGSGGSGGIGTPPQMGFTPPDGMSTTPIATSGGKTLLTGTIGQNVTGITHATNSSPVATATSNITESGSNIGVVDSSPRESGDDSEDESDYLEESPCGRWQKLRMEVDQRDVPGIDCVHLAMDTEEGVEVVWNEVQYGSLQELRAQEEKMRQVFDNLLQLDHQNLVKFHRYWMDTEQAERPRVIFITEYMSSGSLKQFLKRTKRNSKRLPLEAWRRWSTQILSALSYLHSCTPPVIHGNLTCDSIFIQHNGLVKIGTVVPDAVHHSIQLQQHKYAENSTLHFMAPECRAAMSAVKSALQLTTAIDMYAFGMCALEMAALEIQPNAVNDSGSSADPTAITDETILRTINSLEPDLQRDLIFKCLRRNPAERPSANDLLFHPLLFEVHSLKLLAAHCLVFSPKNRTMFSETVIDAMMQRYNQPDVFMAHVKYSHSREDNTLSAVAAGGDGGSTAAAASGGGGAVGPKEDYRLADVPSADKLEKFVEDVKYGVYPLTAFSGKKPPHFRSRAASPERADSVKSVTPEPVDVESRRIVNMMCNVKRLNQDTDDMSMTILLRMDDKMNRQLTCQVNRDDSAIDLTNELVRLGFVHTEDQIDIQKLLEETLRASFATGSAAFEYVAQPVKFTATVNEMAATMGTGNESQVGGNGGMASGAIAKKTTTTTAAGGLVTNTTSVLNQMERNWSVADMMDPNMASMAGGSQQMTPSFTSLTTPGGPTPTPALSPTPPTAFLDANGTIIFVPQGPYPHQFGGIAGESHHSGVTASSSSSMLLQQQQQQQQPISQHSSHAADPTALKSVPAINTAAAVVVPPASTTTTSFPAASSSIN